MSATLTVHAQQPQTRDPVLAEALFQQASNLMDRGEYAQACPKLVESQALDPAPGTLLRLAVCHEAVGKTATAWAEFEQALAWAKRDGRQDRITLAEERIAALEPHLSTLTIVVPAEVAKLTDLEIRRSGVLIGPAAYGVAAPVDPGNITISVTAPGHDAWQTEVTVARDADHQTVTIPALRSHQQPAAAVPPAEAKRAPASAPTTAARATPAPAAPGASHPPDPGASPAQSDQSSVPVVGYAVGGLGVVALGVGSYFGLRALAKKSYVEEQCPSPPTCSSKAGVKANDQASDFARIADVSFAVGVVALGAGTYLVLSHAPTSPPHGRAAERAFRPGADGVMLRALGQF